MSQIGGQNSERKAEVPYWYRGSFYFNDICSIMLNNFWCIVIFFCISGLPFNREKYCLYEGIL